ncbi:MAG TPA: cold shock domain-containing protein [Cyclobacteriaceae bacterium]|nr:cold shock domain-containing protein [Cyclobacteriaceae bacterium]
MAKSSDTFNKREKEKQRLQKKKEKEQRKEERKAGKESKSFEDMIAYVDENGNFSSTPPDLSKKKVIKETDINLSSRNKGGASVADVRQGVIKFFEKDKGYGFIKDKETQEEYFFHYSSANFPVAQSQSVTFEIEPGPKGLNAVRINKAEA